MDAFAFDFKAKGTPVRIAEGMMACLPTDCSLT
jgi:hypothetical protein